VDPSSPVFVAMVLIVVIQNDIDCIAMEGINPDLALELEGQWPTAFPVL
jgi:hypothetical protein